MKLLVKLIVLALIAGAAYLFLVPGASVDDFSKTLSLGLKAVSGKTEAQAEPVTQSTAPTAASPTTAAAVSSPTPKPLQVIRLKNGKSLVGNIVVRDAEMTMIRTADGKSTQVPTKDIVVGAP